MIVFLLITSFIVYSISAFLDAGAETYPRGSMEWRATRRLARNLVVVAIALLLAAVLL